MTIYKTINDGPSVWSNKFDTSTEATQGMYRGSLKGIDK